MDQPIRENQNSQPETNASNGGLPSECLAGPSTPHHSTRIADGAAANPTQRREPSAPQWNRLIRDLEWSDWITAGATVTIAILTGFYVHYAREQWQTANRQLDAMRGQLKQMEGSSAQTDRLIGETHDLASAAKRQAEESRSIADSAREAIERNTLAHRISERAWVDIVPFEPPRKIPGNGTLPDMFVYSIYLRNTGKTVARDVVTKAVTSMGPAAGQYEDNGIRMMQDELFRMMDTGERVSLPVIPNVKALAPNTTTAIPAIIAAAPAQQLRSNVWLQSKIVGRVDYKDDFGVRHWLKFCFSPETSGAVRYCLSGNEVDETPELPPK